MIIGFFFGCASAYLFKKIDLRHSMFEIATYLLLAYIPSLFSAVSHSSPAPCSDTRLQPLVEPVLLYSLLL